MVTGITADTASNTIKTPLANIALATKDITIVTTVIGRSGPVFISVDIEYDLSSCPRVRVLKNYTRKDNGLMFRMKTMEC